MKRRLTALLLAGLMIIMVTACNKGKDTEPSSSEEVKDPNWPVAVGDIRVAEKPDSVVSLSPALTEILCELGGEGQLTGVSDYCDYPDSVQDLERCGTSQLPDLKAIQKLSPQVVFSSSALSQEDTVKLQQMGAEVVVLPHADSVDALEELYVTAGTILGGMVDGEQNGEDTFAPLREKYDAVAAAAKTVEKKLTGIYLRMTPLVMATGDTFEGKLLEEIGIQNAAAEDTVWEYPADKAKDLYPDIIFYDQSVDAQYLKDNQVYNTTDAVKNDRCYEVDAAAFERQSGRMFDELEKMFRKAYPDAEINIAEPESKPESSAGQESESSQETASSSAADEGMLNLEDATKVN